MSRSPQNGGFQRCTGGGPSRAAAVAAPAIESTPRSALRSPWFTWNVRCDRRFASRERDRLELVHSVSEVGQKAKTCKGSSGQPDLTRCGHPEGQDCPKPESRGP